MNIFVFDIETIPDTAGGQRIYGLEGLNAADTASAMMQLRRQQSGTDFLKPHLQRIVAISAVWRNGDQLKVWSLGDPDTDEAELISRFYAGIEKYTPTLVSWNGGGFDLPVLHYRAMLHGISAARYWETGDVDNSFRWNNYLNRFHYRHLDLMDVLAAYQQRAYIALDELATLLGFPGKMGMHGSAVWQHFQDGDIVGIRNYCETDVLNTYLIYLRFELMRGRFDKALYDAECLRLKELLRNGQHSHWHEFLAAWEKNA